MEISTNVSKSDTIGALASGLCLIHCLATPFIFVAKSCTATCCSGAPSWWAWLDVAFLIISFFAVYRSAASTSKKWISQVMWSSWTLLLLVILNEQLGWIHLPEYIIYFPAILLIIIHIYNLKYCQCEGEYCHHNAT